MTDATLTEMRDHAKVALARKPVPLDVELLARDVLTLCGRIATADRYLKKAEDEKTHGLTANAEYIDGMVSAARVALRSPAISPEGRA